MVKAHVSFEKISLGCLQDGLTKKTKIRSIFTT